ncbi:hypothetical protein Dimus_000636 [Dionaea muscipula]
MAKEAAAAAIKIRQGGPAAKPSQHLWVGGIGASVTKEKLEEEFSKFGKIENIKFLKERSIAFVDYLRQEDALEAVKNLNGRQIGDGHLRVDFVRSHPFRREQQYDPRTRDPYLVSMGGPDNVWRAQDLSRSYSLPAFGQQGTQPSQSFVAQIEHQSKVLLVSYPPSVVMDENMLYNSMILYGEIEGIKSFPARNYTLIEFRSVEEAWRAKESLEGRLLNDPRITIIFSAGESAPVNDLSPSYLGLGGAKPERHGNELALQVQQVDEFCLNHGAGANHFSGAQRPGVPRPFGLTSGADSLLQLPDLSHPTMLHNRGLSPPSTGLLPPHGPASGTQQKMKSSGWDVLDVSQLPRESKRPRINGGTPFHDPSSTFGMGDNAVVGMEGGTLGQLAEVHGSSRFDLPDVRVADRHNGTQTNNDYIWRGVIAKGGTIICQARCIPIGQGIQCKLPDVINCSAKTGLDMLTKHYADAGGYEVSFFLPDSEEDFASYTEFLHYLGSRDRAGVAKFDDGTAFFLVPPSDFLRKVLNVVGPERLYGVVLKSRHQVASDVSNQQPVYQPMPSIHTMTRQQDPLYNDYALGAPKQQSFQQASVPHQKTSVPSGTESLVARSVSEHPSSNSKSSLEQAGVSLTPELVASLASLLPTSALSSVGQSAQLPLNSVTGGQLPPSSVNGGLPAPMPLTDKGTSQGWNQQYQYFHHTLSQQHGHQLDSVAQSSTATHAHPIISSSSNQVPTTMQSPSFSYPLLQQVANPSRLPNTLPDAVQSQSLAAHTQATQHHQFGVPHNSAQVSRLAYGAAPTGSYGFPDAQQPINPGSFNNQIPAATFPHPNGAAGPEGDVPPESLNQVNVVQPVPSAGNQGAGEAEVDKDQRYQSTLQFAANLLLQIQQRQQEQSQLQPGPKTGLGGNQQ